MQAALQQRWLCEATADWDRIQQRLRNASRICLFTAFDGALSPVADDPRTASLDGDVRLVLRRLAVHPRIIITVLSGRSVTDVKAKVGLPLIFGGDHGCEIHGPDFDYTVPGAEKFKAELPDLCRRLERAVQPFPGASVQAKRLSAGVHYGSMRADRLEQLVAAVEQSVDSSRYSLRWGARALEVCPILEWSKGHAALWLLNQLCARQEHAICMGHDASDADMFRHLPDAVNVQVGFEGLELGAPYWVPQPELTTFLLCILRLLKI